MYLIAACLPNLRPLFSSLSPKKIISRFSDTSKSKTEDDINLAYIPGGHSGFTQLEARPGVPSYHAGAARAEREPVDGQLRHGRTLQSRQNPSDMAIDITTDIRVSSLRS